MEKIKGGLSDNKTLLDIAKKHAKNQDAQKTYEELKIQLKKGISVEMEHTKDKGKAREIAMDHLYEDPKYYTKLKKVEAKEMTGASSSGSYVGKAFTNVVKREIKKIHNSKPKKIEATEATDASSSGAFDVPLFGKTTKGRKNPLSIGGPETIKNSRAVKDKNFPKWGGPDSVFVKIKEKCKKFPYCNQGDIRNIEPLREAIESTSKKYGISKDEVENIILNEIKQIFI